MIQRIQTVFYLLATACASALFFLPMASSNVAGSPFMEDKLFNVQDHIALLIVAGLAAIIPLVAIFLFKNRPIQMRIGYVGIIFSILILTAAIVLFVNGGKDMSNAMEINDELGLYFPIGAIVFSALANRFVKKDDKLVDSMERLR